MPKISALFSFLLLYWLCACTADPAPLPTNSEPTKTASAPIEPLREGDIVFQSSMSGQSEAIQLATHSKYSHCGILYKREGKWLVFEAVQPVKLTPLDEWIANGDDGHFVVKRLIKADSLLIPAALAAMKEEGEKMRGKDYDLLFEWSDDKIYCSELVWKIYQRALNIELGNRQRLSDFDLSQPVVRKKLEERYGKGNKLHKDWVISPAAIFDSPLLFTVQTGGI